MIEDELRCRSSITDDIRSQNAQRMPQELHVGEWVAVVIAIAVVAFLIWNIGG